MKSLAGNLLIASPFLGDQNFNKSVVLIIQHTEEGAFGLVLNRPTNFRMADVWDIVSDDEPCPADAVIHYGGPVEGPLMALHTKRSRSEHEQERLKPGMRNVLAGFGVGWSWAGCVWTETWNNA